MSTRFSAVIMTAIMFCGLRATAEESAFDPVAVLKALTPGRAATVTIPPGVYRLPHGNLALSNLKDVTINAKDVTFLASDTTHSAIRLTNCDHVTIDGLTIDYDPLPVTQGSIISINREAGTADFEVHAGYPELSKPFLIQRFHLFEKNEHRWKRGAPDFYIRKIERLEARKGRVYFQDDGLWQNHIEVGDRLAIGVGGAPALGFNNGCRNTYLKDVTIYSSPAAAIIIRFVESVGTFERLRIVPGPRPPGATQERLMSSWADAFNAAYARKGPVLDHCEFSYQGDDGVNLHGVILPVLEWQNGKTFLSMRLQGGEPWPQFLLPGDELRFLAEPDFRLLSTARIAKVEVADESLEKWRPLADKIWPTFNDSKKATFIRITLEKEITSVPAGSFCESFLTAAPDYIIRNSYFHDHRGRALRLMAGNGVVDRNRIERIKGVAISLGPEFGFWKEAGWVQNVSITNNKITDVGEGANLTWPDSYTIGAISIFARILPAGNKTVYYPGNENITISGNTIDGCPVDGINISAAQKVTVTDNTIRRINLQPGLSAGKDYGLIGGQPISTTQASAKISDNSIQEKPLSSASDQSGK